MSTDLTLFTHLGSERAHHRQGDVGF